MADILSPKEQQNDNDQRGPYWQDGLALELVAPRIVIPPELGGIAVMLRGISIHRLSPGSAPCRSLPRIVKRAGRYLVHQS